MLMHVNNTKQNLFAMDRTAGFYSKPSTHSAHPLYERKKQRHQKSKTSGLFNFIKKQNFSHGTQLGLGVLYTLMLLPSIAKGAARRTKQFINAAAGPTAP